MVYLDRQPSPDGLTTFWTKKREVYCYAGYGRFRSIKMITSPIAIIAAVPMPNTYVSVIVAGVGVGAGVVGASVPTAK